MTNLFLSVVMFLIFCGHSSPISIEGVAQNLRPAEVRPDLHEKRLKRKNGRKKRRKTIIFSYKFREIQGSGSVQDGF